MTNTTDLQPTCVNNMSDISSVPSAVTTAVAKIEPLVPSDVKKGRSPGAKRRARKRLAALAASSEKEGNVNQQLNSLETANVSSADTAKPTSPSVKKGGKPHEQGKPKDVIIIRKRTVEEQTAHQAAEAVVQSANIGQDAMGSSGKVPQAVKKRSTRKARSRAQGSTSASKATSSEQPSKEDINLQSEEIIITVKTSPRLIEDMQAENVPALAESAATAGLLAEKRPDSFVSRGDQRKVDVASATDGMLVSNVLPDGDIESKTAVITLNDLPILTVTQIAGTENIEERNGVVVIVQPPTPEKLIPPPRNDQANSENPAKVGIVGAQPKTDGKVAEKAVHFSTTAVGRDTITDAPAVVAQDKGNEPLTSLEVHSIVCDICSTSDWSPCDSAELLHNRSRDQEPSSSHRLR